ncbi:ATP-binding protein [Mucilaginibacter phyllosphaerae]
MNSDDTLLLNTIEGQGQLLTAAIGASISGIVITDNQQEDNPIIFCNKAFEEMTGYYQHEIIGRNCRFLQAGDREQIGRFKLQEALASNMECHVELANYRKDGTMFFNELYVAPIKNSQGKVTHYIGVQNDITLRKQKELSMAMELKLQKQKDEFTSLASHELRTPITSLRATIQLMNRIIKEKQIQDERIGLLAKNAERHTKKLSSLVDDLLITTILSNEGLILEKTSFAFTEVIDACCSHLFMNGSYSIEQQGDKSITMFADRYKIDQVMFHLLSNAVSFSPASKRISISIEQLDNVVKVAVTDNGIGIAERDISTIFKRFQKVQSKKHHQSGFGMGLYICSEIIHRHGGQIGVTSDLGKGSTFWFTIPNVA